MVLRNALRTWGLTDAIDLAGIVGDSVEEAEQLALDVTDGSVVGAGPALLKLGQLARPLATSARNRLARTSTPLAVVHASVWLRGAKRAFEATRFEEAAAAVAPPLRPLAKGAPASWPSKLHRSLDLAGDPAGRRRAEDTERTRWATELASLVKEAVLPLAALAAQGERGEAALLRAAQGRRASTIRRRVRDWWKARRFFLASTGKAFPTNAAQVLDYIEACAEDRAARHAIESFSAALAFLERGGGVPESGALHRHPLVVAAAADVKATSGPGLARPRKKAPRLPLALVAAAERAVLAEELPQFVRMYAWWRLLKVWCALRWDDHRGLVPASLVVGAGLRGTLSRTKTSGPDKQTELLPIFVGTDAFLEDKAWLQVGWGLWQKVHPHRDFFVGVPCDDLQGMRPIEARYADGLGMGRALLARLVSASGERLLLPGVERFWTEHSDRATLPSLATTLSSFPSDWIDTLGRWSAKVSSGYVRNLRHKVETVQHAVARAYRGCENPASRFGEGDVWEALELWMTANGYTDDEVSTQIGLLAPKRVPSAADFDPLCIMDEMEAGPAMADGTLSEGPRSPTELASDVERENEAAELEEGLAEMLDAPLSGMVVAAPGAPSPPIGAFVVATRTRSKFRTLHRVGSCYRRPGLDFLEFSVHEELPSATAFDAACRACFRHGAPIAEQEEASTGSSSDEA